MSTPVAIDAIEFKVESERLILTVTPDLLHVCRHCPNLHILVLAKVTKQELRKLAAGIAHLAEHLP